MTLQLDHAEYPDGMGPGPEESVLRASLRAAGFGAALIGGITALRAINVIAAFSEDRHRSLEGLFAVVVGAFGGAAAGSVYGFTGRELRPLGTNGVSLQAAFTLVAYFIALGDLSMLTNDQMFGATFLWYANPGLLLLIGIAVAYARRRRT